MNSKGSRARSGAGGSLVKLPCECCAGLGQPEAGKLSSIQLGSLLCLPWCYALHLKLNTCLGLCTLEKNLLFSHRLLGCKRLKTPRARAYLFSNHSTWISSTMGAWELPGCCLLSGSALPHSPFRPRRLANANSIHWLPGLWSSLGLANGSHVGRMRVKFGKYFPGPFSVGLLWVMSVSLSKTSASVSYCPEASPMQPFAWRFWELLSPLPYMLKA